MGGNTSSLNEDLRDVIHGSTLPLSFSSRDERVEITADKVPPYSWVCKMTVETQQGNKYSATGFKIAIKPSLSHQVVLTSGHTVFIEGALAKRVTLTFPGQKTISVSTKKLWAPKEFTDSKNPDYNFGVVMIPNGTSDDGFNWTTLLTDDELTGRPLYCCGYPSDKEKGSLWITGGGVESVSKNMIQYMYDSKSVSSGSPVYTWDKAGYWMVVGIQSYSGNFNSAVRLTVDMMRKVLSAVGFQFQYTVQSKEFTDIYMCTHMNTLDIDKEEEIVTIGYYKVGANATSDQPQRTFDIIPLCTILSNEAKKVVCVSPTSCQDAYLCLKRTLRQNGNQVVASSEISKLYVHEMEDGSVALESVSEPGLYLSLSQNLTAASDQDSNKQQHASITQCSNTMGTFTCNDFSKKSADIGSTEKFILHPQMTG